jgi:hypothetical protein
MGNINKTKHLKADLEKVNSITRNELFVRTTGMYIVFSYQDDYSFFKKIFISKIIQVDIIPRDNHKNKRRKLFWIDLQTFYGFLNTLMDSLLLFYEHSIRKSIIKKSNPKEEDELCCICDEKRTNIMLECCVRI